VQTRCCIDVGRSGRYALEFVLAGGNLTFDWCTIPGYRPQLARPLDPGEALAVATEVSITAFVKDLSNMIVDESILVTRVKPDSFQVTDRTTQLVRFTVLVSHREGQIFVHVQFDETQPARDISENPFYLLRRILCEQKES